ncbi:hypothetical protein [Actinokineospora iranica]|uniref:Uncharacterized protein n=1 Tax=Actinokineospora iranica TaxID=1271860 RepID=A0A1G6W823_9PSEU|nr:hypothetical protein [Actinokineospora iranica]SDD61843.1 hypothetical protein SAMN05216174_11454 [Actinokineospora iranica]
MLLLLASHLAVLASGLAIFWMWVFGPSEAYDSAAQLAIAAGAMTVLGFVGLGLRLVAPDNSPVIAGTKPRLAFTVVGLLFGGYHITPGRTESGQPMLETDQAAVYLEAVCALIFAGWGVVNLLRTWMASRRAERAPLSTTVEDRLRRGRPVLLLLRWGIGATALLTLGAAVPAFPGRDLPAGLLVVPAVLAVVCAIYFGNRRDQPTSWPYAAAMAGAVLALQVGPMIALLIPFRPWVLALMVAVMGVVIGSLHALGEYGRDKVLVPYGPDLIDSPIELPFRARKDRGHLLLVAAGEINTHRSSPFTLKRRTLPRPMTEIASVRVVTENEGESVRIAFVDGEQWVFPTDAAQRIAELIVFRRARLAGSA